MSDSSSTTNVEETAGETVIKRENQNTNENDNGSKNKQVSRKRAMKAGDNATRVNYLFQAAQQVAKACPSLNQHYGKIMTIISEKTTAKRDFTMKRSMCKKCHAVLVLGVNSSYRLRRRKGRNGFPTQVITCLNCKTVKRFPTTPDYKLKAEKAGAVESR